MQNGSGESCESASTSSVGSNNSHSKAPGSQLQQKNNIYQNSLNNNGHCNISANSGSGVPTTIPQFSDFAPDLSKQLQAIDNDPMMGALEKEQRKRMCLTFSLQQNMSPLDKYRK